MKRLQIFTDVQRVFLASPLNGALYLGEQLPETSWQWPKDTFLQRRMAALKRGGEMTVDESDRQEA